MKKIYSLILLLVVLVGCKKTELYYKDVENMFHDYDVAIYLYGDSISGFPSNFYYTQLTDLNSVPEIEKTINIFIFNKNKIEHDELKNIHEKFCAAYFAVIFLNIQEYRDSIIESDFDFNNTNISLDKGIYYYIYNKNISCIISTADAKGPASIIFALTTLLKEYD